MYLCIVFKLNNEHKNEQINPMQRWERNTFFDSESDILGICLLQRLTAQPGGCFFVEVQTIPDWHTFELSFLHDDMPRACAF